MKRLLFVLTVATGLAVGAIPVADAAPPAGRCSRQELVGVRGGTEGIGASDITGGGASYISDDPADTTSTRRFTAGIQLADGACNGVKYHIRVVDADSGEVLHAGTDGINGPVDATSVTLLSGAVYTATNLSVSVWTSSSIDAEIDRAPNSGAFSYTIDIGGGQSWN